MRFASLRQGVPRGLLLAFALAACGAVRGDDVIVEAGPAAGPGDEDFTVMAAQDLEQLFDARVFADDAEAVFPADAEGGPDAAAAGLAGARRRAAARIAVVERIAGLTVEQRKKLEVAADTDLRRLEAAVEEARRPYAGRTLRIDPGGLDEAAEQEMARCLEDAERCRRLVQAACGPESLLAKVVTGTLDERQARTYEAAIRDRRACRWRAVVAAGLVQWDEVLGLTQRQYAALEERLLADPPPLAEEGADPEAGRMPAFLVVGGRLAVLGEAVLTELLDPRQRAAVKSQAGAGGEPPAQGFGGMF